MPKGAGRDARNQRNDIREPSAWVTYRTWLRPQMDRTTYELRGSFSVRSNIFPLGHQIRDVSAFTMHVPSRGANVVTGLMHPSPNLISLTSRS